MNIAVLERPKANFKSKSHLVPNLIASSTLALTIANPFTTNELPPTYIPDSSSDLIESFFRAPQQEIFLQKLHYSIRNYGTYEDNWDGYNGIPAKEETIRDALNFLKLLPSDIALPFSGLSGDGEINLFWDRDGIFIDIGFTGDSQFSYFARDSKGKEFSGNYILISSSLPKDIINLIKK